MKIILIGNYLPDKQESMERFAKMLQFGYSKFGIETEIWRPSSFLGSLFKTTTSGLGKWVGYIDKWIIFPAILRLRRFKLRNQKDLHFHVCDHSNSPYLQHLPSDAVITCHDVLAIRGAMGYADSYCPSSGAGKILQKWILTNLSRSKKLASVSHFTLRQLKEIDLYKSTKKNWHVIHNGFNAPFYPMPAAEAEAILSKYFTQKGKPFLLHVGSSLPRKNRKLLLEMTTLLKDWDGLICYAGHQVDQELADFASTNGLSNRVIQVTNPPHKTLVALYSSCEAFIFPSLSEGFGWPVIEAQACGAPVIASNFDPMPEVSGGAAFHRDPNNPGEFADALMLLQNTSTRMEMIENGKENGKRFSEDTMMKAYIELHKS